MTIMEEFQDRSTKGNVKAISQLETEGSRMFNAKMVISTMED